MIRRMVEADALRAKDFLEANYLAPHEDAHRPVEDALKHMLRSGQDLWVLDDSGTVRGVLQGDGRNCTVDWNGRVWTANRFTVLVVQYDAMPVERGVMARDLTLFAADDLRDNGGMQEIIWVWGHKDSRGAQWARRLGMEEVPDGDNSNFYLPFKDIWEAAKRAVPRRVG